MASTVTGKIIDGIATVEGTPSQNLDVSLQEWIETDAIRQLVAHERSSWALQFKVQNHNVRVMGDETVFVDGKQRQSPE